MLNRLMFVYFIQKKGFLDGDRDYLRNRLTAGPAASKGKDKFHSFYRYFLLRLFHEGLGQRRPSGRRARQAARRCPYLNGGLFDVHELEADATRTSRSPTRRSSGSSTSSTPTSGTSTTARCASDNEINPDVLGYIFEKYINQKQMGAYYTKEDITEYISKNTIIPFLFDAAETKCTIAFEPDEPPSGDCCETTPTATSTAVRHGVIDDPATSARRTIAAGVDRRVASATAGTSRPPSEFALPTETWREHVARRQRYERAARQARGGEVHDINDLITSTSTSASSPRT